jgi:hypothetical protein
MRRAPALLLAALMAASAVFCEAAQASRLDDAARALRSPGVWVDADLSWRVVPAQARRLDRAIVRAGVAVRVAVLPRLEVDESRGDARAIARAIIRRVDRDGLYVLVDQDGRFEYAARNLPLDLSGFSFPSALAPDPMTLDKLVPIVRQAQPAAAVSFEPDPPFDASSSDSDSDDSLIGVAFGATLIGALGGFCIYLLVRVAAAAFVMVNRRA